MAIISDVKGIASSNNFCESGLTRPEEGIWSSKSKLKLVLSTGKSMTVSSSELDIPAVGENAGVGEAGGGGSTPLQSSVGRKLLGSVADFCLSSSFTSKLVTLFNFSV
uniref:Uncharacterized protein n=1 Tax=Cacopsylla melanoneura TaxID=428564 RepID=A0A8D9FA67_9HEMI